MGENSKIQWCDHTFNPWRGCTKVAAGCANCYAEAQSKRNTATLGVWGPNGTRVVAAEAAWRQVERWERDAKMREESYQIAAMTCRSEYDLVEPCYPPAIFCGSMCDVFEDWPGEVRDSRGRVVNPRTWRPIESEGPAPATIGDARQRLFRTIDATPNLTWLLLTKRTENVGLLWLPRDLGERSEGISEGDYGYHQVANHAYRRDNVYLGTSIACQEDAERNIPELLKCRDLCRGVFLSIEPLIGPVDLTTTCLHVSRETYGLGGAYMSPPHAGVDQVIVGGESGPNARPCRVEWVRSIVRQCQAAGVPCFVKQLGANPVGLRFSIDDNGSPFCIEGDCFRGGEKPLDKKGGDPAEWPEDLRVRRLAWKGGA